MTKKKELTSKQKQKLRKKIFVYAASLLIGISLITGLMLCLNITDNSSSFKLEDRTKQIAKEKKKDEKGYETIAWLRVQGTKIDTPVVNYEDVEAIENISKDDFLWNENKNEKLYDRVNIQGHNILNLSSKPEVGLEYFSKFEELMSFVYTDFAKENQYIQYTVDGENYLYQIFAVYFEDDYKLDLYNSDTYTKEDIAKFINESMKKSIYKFDTTVKDEDKIITLITCTRMYGVDDAKQFVVVGKMINSNSKTSTKELKETKSYEEIKKILRGDEENVEA